MRDQFVAASGEGKRNDYDRGSKKQIRASHDDSSPHVVSARHGETDCVGSLARRSLNDVQPPEIGQIAASHGA
jgi:hypothetical protein